MNFRAFPGIASELRQTWCERISRNSATGPPCSLASFETGAGESGGATDVGAVSEDDEGGGDDDIEDVGVQFLLA